jgi:Cu(I)/Ag(I) efflux system membrane fusion protein
MSTRMQISISAVIVLAAVGGAALGLRSADGVQGDQEAGGHDHAAMTAGSGEMSPVVLDAEGARRIGVSYATVEHRELPAFVRTVGIVSYDETRLATVNPKISGWVERLFVDFTGAPVRAGQPLLEIYSPALVSAQEELVLAVRLARDAREGRARTNAVELLESARRRLAYWDIPEEEIRRIEETGETTKTLTLRAPASGIVVEKNVVEGDRIMPGMTVYRIADLSRVWIEVDVFEKDLGLVRHGQGAIVTFEAFPGEAFPARVTYVYPTVSLQSRTGRIRLELANRGLDLKPGMYAQISLELLPSAPTLVVPRSAVIQTGQRTLVFVSTEDGRLLPREVTPGRTSGRFMELLDGVVMGERVVSSAAFLVDAESNLGTMAGDMSDTEEGTGETDHSEHDMEAMDMPADTGGVDHSNHD